MKNNLLIHHNKDNYIIACKYLYPVSFCINLENFTTHDIYVHPWVTCLKSFSNLLILIWRSVSYMYKVCYWLFNISLSCCYKVVKRILTLITQKSFNGGHNYCEMCFGFFWWSKLCIHIYKKEMQWKKTFQLCCSLKIFSFPSAEI